MRSTHSTPSFSVIIPTRNRATLLPKLLDSLERQTYSVQRFEVIVVDNDPDDAQTKKVVTDRQKTWQHLVYVNELQRGASPARNAGCQQARFPYLIFIDDDVTIKATFLKGYAEAWQRHPQARILGGGITTELDIGQTLTAQQLRLIDTYPWCFTHRGQVDQDQVVGLGHFVYSANMSYRRTQPLKRSSRHSIPSIELFSSRLGVQLCNNEQFGGEDFELCARTLLAGESVVWVRGADTEVSHQVSLRRFDPEYLYRRHLWAGIEMRVLEAELRTRFPAFTSFYRSRLKTWSGIHQFLTDHYARAMALSYWFNGPFFTKETNHDSRR